MLLDILLLPVCRIILMLLFLSTSCRLSDWCWENDSFFWPRTNLLWVTGSKPDECCLPLYGSVSVGSLKLKQSKFPVDCIIPPNKRIELFLMRCRVCLSLFLCGKEVLMLTSTFLSQHRTEPCPKRSRNNYLLFFTMIYDMREFSLDHTGF